MWTPYSTPWRGMSGQTETVPRPRRFGELSGPLLVASVVLGWFAAVSLFVHPTQGSVPQQFVDAIPLLLANFAIGYGALLLILVAYVVLAERRRTVVDVLAALGFRRQGIRSSLVWGLALFPLYAIAGVLTLLVASYVAPPSGSGPIPAWYPYYLILYTFFPVAVVEEAFGRGYLLDRLMPDHPSGLVRAAPAILLSSFLFSLFHIPSYLAVYAFSPARTFLLLAFNVFPLSALLGVAYVRSRTRNVAGPVLIHFLLDALPYVLFVVL